jgi:3-phosphoshikimate 1-carboxyvinyltransferase
VESKPYIDITTKILSDFGADISENGNIYKVRHSDLQSGAFNIEGDWSNAAFLLALGAWVSGLDRNSAQGDRKILDVFCSFGAELIEDGNSIRVSLANLHGTEIDASDIPDLVPVISAIAATADGTTKIYNATRLRLKESDRIKSTVEMINSLGGDAHETEDGIIINGRKSLSGGMVESFNDHRIVMAAAVASQKCENCVIINNAQAVNKSYPEFFKDFNSLGGDTNVM